MPAELRNTIYRYCLINSSTIQITSTPKTPPLLATNRQIRSEAVEIYHLENAFGITVINCDSRLYQAYVQNVLIPLGRDISSHWFYSTLAVGPLSQGAWENLLRWSRLVWEGYLPGGQLRDNALDSALSKTIPVISAAINIAGEGRRVPWDVVERTLAGLRLMAVHLDDGWRPQG